MTENQIAEAKTFQQRMFESIRERMGELMTEEELKKIVETSVQKAFFEPYKRNGEYGRIIEEEPVFIKLMREHFFSQLKSCLDEYIAANPQIISDQINNAIGRGFTQTVADYFNRNLASAINEFGRQVDSMFSRKN